MTPEEFSCPMPPLRKTMTPEEFSRQMPKLSNNPLPFKPPFIFNGLSSRVFPLRANLDALQRLCNGYLNFVPESVGRFRASVPYVFLSVLDYGQVAESRGLGWFAQTEVFFAVSLEWYKKVNGRWVFHDWATITPFIYVNDNYSVPLGRTVSGFPKVLAKVTAVDSEWVRDPLAPITLARVETEVFPAAYAGRRLESRVFMEVKREAPMSNLRVPMDPRSPAAPWTVASNIADALGGFGRDALWLAQALRIFPQVPAGQMPGMLPEMLARMAPALAPGGPGMVTNSLNLKQFRRADQPENLCYQALTNGPMITSAFNGGGLLGEERTLLGDLSGGHSIQLHEYATLPIARTLGLEVSRRWKDGGVDVAEIKPVIPFWMDVNVSMQPSLNLAWRGQEGVWRDNAGSALPPDEAPAAPAVVPPPPPKFYPSLSSAIEAITGPFRYTGTTFRVLPLLAMKDKLQAFLDKSINDALKDPVFGADGKCHRMRMSVWARPRTPVNKWGWHDTDETIPREENWIGGQYAYVYMAAASFKGVTSTTNNVGDWAKFELSFLVPVCWERETAPDQWVTEGVGVVPAYFFVDDCIATASRFEVQGIDARTADFVQAGSVWMSDEAEEDNPRQTLLRMDAEVWAALESGQQAMVQPLVEIVQNEDNAGLGRLAAQDKAFAWAEALRLELGTKKGAKARFPQYAKVARALALELLGNQAPLAMYSLKQFRDAGDPDKACFQSLVRVSRQLQEVVDVCEIEETLTVRIHDFPNLDIVNTLGLVATCLENNGAGVLYSAQAIRPFYVRGTMVEPLAEQLMTRTGWPVWELDAKAFGGRLGSAPAEGCRLVVNLEAENQQDRADPCHMGALMFNARTQNNEHDPNKQPISASDARHALKVIDPQMVIESVLSREWGNADSSARWRRARRDLVAAAAGLPRGGKLRPAAEAAMYRALIHQQMALQGASEKLKQDAEVVIVAQDFISRIRVDMETYFDTLAPWLLMDYEDWAHTTEGKKPDDPTLLEASRQLLISLVLFKQLTIAGEPSNRNYLDQQVGGFANKLNELLDGPLAKLVSADGFKSLSGTEGLLRVKAATEPLREAVTMARKLSSSQREAMLNTLSRAWQKPDFCIRRDAVSSERDRLLTTMGSWDEDWYFGKRFDDVKPESKPTKKPTQKPTIQTAIQTTIQPTIRPTKKPTKQPTKKSTKKPTKKVSP